MLLPRQPKRHPRILSEAGSGAWWRRRAMPADVRWFSCWADAACDAANLRSSNVVTSGLRRVSYTCRGTAIAIAYRQYRRRSPARCALYRARTARSCRAASQSWRRDRADRTPRRHRAASQPPSLAPQPRDHRDPTGCLDGAGRQAARACRSQDHGLYVHLAAKDVLAADRCSPLVNLPVSGFDRGSRNE